MRDYHLASLVKGDFAHLPFLILRLGVTMTREFSYNGKNRKCLVFHEALDENGNLTAFDGIELTYLEEDAANKCLEFFKDKEVKPFPTKGSPSEKIEGADSDWFRAWRRYKASDMKM